MPAGAGPFGLGTPVSANPPPRPGAGSRFIDPATRSYGVDAVTGQLQQMPPLRQRVLLALSTELGSSSALTKLGVLYPRKMHIAFEAEAQASCRTAVRQMTEVEGIMRIDGITVERGAAGRGRLTLAYTDLTTGEADTVSVF